MQALPENTDRSTSASVETGETSDRREAYISPRIFLLGKASELVRNDAKGTLRDSSPNGWWIRAL